jgi:sugar/nucleoside kinase (ribokinase family)
MRALYQNEGEQLAETFRLAKQAGATTSLDMSLPDPRSESGQAPWSRILEKTLPNVDIFLPSVEEALFMLRRERFLALKQQTGGAEAIDLLEPNDYRDLSSALLELGSSLIVLKSAHRGFYLRTAGGKRVAGIGPAAPAQPEEWASREVWCPAFHVGRIASATGSGDSSIAGFLAALLRGESLPRCLRFANAVGAQNLTELDAVSGIKGWEETVAQVNDRSLALNDLPLREGADGWQLDSQAQVWERQRGS